MNPRPRASYLLRSTFSGMCCLFGWRPSASAAFRFPRPDFDVDYSIPVVVHPHADAHWIPWLDVALLALALAVAAYLILKQRSRAWVWGLMVTSLAYFGFYREGCICPIGSIQNVTLGIADPNVAVPVAVVAFFALPLLFALLFGRVFCAAVCPLGAIQDAFLMRPLRLPKPLTQVLGVIPYLYLVTAVVFAAGGSGFLICRYDPFVAMFRLSGEAEMLAFGGALLAIGMVVGRPYCRFLCPYGVLLNWMSRFAWRHATITPDECITCRLCEKACPFDSIKFASGPRFGEGISQGTRRTGRYLLMLPILAVVGWMLGAQIGPAIAHLDPTVQTAEQVWREDVQHVSQTTLRSESFRTTGKSRDALLAQARVTRKLYERGGAWLGALAGLLIGTKLLTHSLRSMRDTYEIDRGSCFSCTRCFASCPQEQARRRVSFVSTQSLIASAQPEVPS